jgi:ATP-dependent 26S proteasome regulatory subunit
MTSDRIGTRSDSTKLLADSAPKEQVEKEWEELRQERTSLEPRYEEAKRGHRQKREEQKEIQETFKHAQAKWNKLQDDKTQRRDRIFRQQPKLREVYSWIQDNRQLFRKEVICHNQSRDCVISSTPSLNFEKLRYSLYVSATSCGIFSTTPPPQAIHRFSLGVF